MGIALPYRSPIPVFRNTTAFGRRLDRDALLEQLDGLFDLVLAQAPGSKFPQFARSLVVCHV